MSVDLLVYVNGFGVHIDVHPDILARYSNLQFQEVNHDTPSKIAAKNLEYLAMIDRSADLEARRPMVKKLVSNLLSD